MTMLTLSDGATTLELDPDLYWEDEFRWSSTVQSVELSVTGALIVDVGTKLAGRPITLRNEDESSGWMTRETIAQLQAWADIPGLVMQLTLRGVAYQVIGRHHDGGMLEARPETHYADPEPADWVLATLRFMTVSE